MLYVQIVLISDPIIERSEVSEAGRGNDNSDIPPTITDRESLLQTSFLEKVENSVLFRRFKELGGIVCDRSALLGRQ